MILRRYVPRWTLQGAFLALTVCVVALNGWRERRAKQWRQENALAVLKSVGAEVESGPTLFVPGRRVTFRHDYQRLRLVTDADLALVADSGHVQELYLENASHLTPIGWRQLALQPRLGLLYARGDGNRLEVEALRLIAGLPALEVLVIERQRLSREALEQLSLARRLRHLALRKCYLADADLAALPSLLHLEELDLSSNDRLSSLEWLPSKLPRLRKLWVQETAITRNIASAAASAGLQIEFASRGCGFSLPGAPRMVTMRPRMQRAEIMTSALPDAMSRLITSELIEDDPFR